MLTLEPLPESHSESSQAPVAPGNEHGDRGPRLVIQDMGGYSCSTRTGYWRWCGACGAWQKAVGILSAMVCPKCHKAWS